MEFSNCFVGTWNTIYEGGKQFWGSASRGLRRRLLMRVTIRMVVPMGYFRGSERADVLAAPLEQWYGLYEVILSD